MNELAIGPRARRLNDAQNGPGPVIHWISRDQRAADNWTLAEACELASEADSYVVSVFCLQSSCGAASRRHFEFMLDGLAELAVGLAEIGIPLLVRQGDATVVLPAVVGELSAGVVVCDFAPLRRSRSRRARLAADLSVPLIEVDSRNVVPAWIAADKQLYAAHHLRGRYERLLPEYLAELPPAAKSRGAPTDLFERFDRDAALAWISAEDHGPPLSIASGEQAARLALDVFIRDRLSGYATRRGNPSSDGQSGLSPYLHFGQLSIQRAVAEVMAAAAGDDVDEFVDEAVVWRELAENFCFFQPAYARVEGFADWARATLSAHAGDAREVVYSLAEFESADTHDPLWNAAQTELVRTGKMHNYLRMYWAKKILEWSESPEEAMRIAVLLNDRYSVDGRDPNGYAGIAWSIGGVHDRAWPERAVYGKIRYMNYNGAKRKFDVEAYIARATGADGSRLF